MISLKAYLFSWFTWLFLKRSYQSSLALHQKLESARKNLRDHKPSPTVYARFLVDERQIGGHPVYTIRPKSSEASAAGEEAHILYMHGGGFCFEIGAIHWTMAANLAERLCAVVFVPIYPLGPEFKITAIQKMLQLTYDDVAAKSIQRGKPFWAVGDSAGAHSAIVLTQEAFKAGKPTASRLVLISPPVDGTFANPDVHEAAKRDPWFDIPAMYELGVLLRGDMALDDPRLSPLFGDVDGLPPMLVFAAENDLLTPDTKLFVEKARDAGRDVTLVVGKGMMHIWPLLGFRESKEAIDQMVDWLERAKSLQQLQDEE